EVYEPLQRYLRRRAASSDADELLDDVLLVLWRRLDDIPPGAVLPWCYGVARRALANQRRSTRRRRNLLERLGSSPASVSMNDVDVPELEVAFEQLGEADRELLRLWAWEELEPREIAVVLGITVNAASLRLGRAKQRLRAEYRRQNDDLSGHMVHRHTGELRQ
ncbi:MAG: sigma-70 family RNA polymerase sigma factor, partial [Acidimicrobiia bacterium]|nr:sigma-70 family RNA polymerase sigma factor [Acidimicrobiia bacterium]